MEVITSIRNIRNTKQVSPKTPLHLEIRSEDKGLFTSFEQIIKKLSNIETISYTLEKAGVNTAGFTVKGIEFGVVLPGIIDTDKERENLQKELEYTKGFLTSVHKKLQNEKFVNNAPEQVLQSERKKQADAEAKIKALEEMLTALNG
jgi:valyl-tRNA synthetase